MKIDTTMEACLAAATALRMNGHHDKAALLEAVARERDALLSAKPRDTITPQYSALFEFGVAGYHYGNETFVASNIDELEALIRQKINEFADKLTEAQERNGDLRGFAPRFANGYPTLCFEPEIGEDFSVTLMSLRLGDTELEYRSAECERLRRQLGVY